MRLLTAEEREERAARLRKAAKASPASQGSGSILTAPENAFIAKTARLSGRVVLKDRSSVFFGCEFDAGGHEIEIGENSNVQDNTIIRCELAGTVIGRDVTIGHNVRVAGCRVGERALLGIGSVIAAGTVIADDVMVAAGAVTLPGQTLESGWLGRPAATPLSRLDDAKRGMMATIIEHYSAYADAYRKAQDRAGAGE